MRATTAGAVTTSLASAGKVSERNNQMMPGLSVDAKVMRDRSVEDNYNITAGIGSI